ncbi:GNAT family N-acetyltransferase [Nocardia sp. NPDC051832]|uniref:GNAT family N-acetyltransferase n=1 Tax=Nocardia sp. NPDC051832 TaxID=3155673 RepID=UPI003421F8D9
MAISQKVSVRVVTAAEAEARLDEVCALYSEVFSEPPNIAESPEHHRAAMLRMLSDPSFGCAIAECLGELAGFVYGYGLKSARWWQGMRDPLPAGFTAEWQGRSFAVIDIGVRRRWRRNGIGARLMETLLAERQEQRATLGMIPDLTDSARFYAATGWRLVGRQDSPPDAGWVAPVFDVYTRPIGTVN